MTRSGADLERAAAEIPRGTSRQQVRELLGDPLVTSDLANGGQAWLYVENDPEHGQFESISVVFGPSGGFEAVEHKPID